MIVQRYYTGFSFARIGGLSFALTNDGSGIAYTATMSSGQYYHGLLADTGVGFDHSAFATAFAAALNAAATAAVSSVTWAVTWNNATLRYTVLPSGGGGFSINSVAGTLNSVAQNVLGMASSFTGVTTVGVRTPYYVIDPHINATSDNTGDVHVRGQVKSAITDGGRQFGVGPTTRATVHRWTQKHEASEATFVWDAGTAWSYEHLFEHVGVWEPILICIDAATTGITVGSTRTSMRCSLLGSDADFAPVPTFANYDQKWDIPFSTVVDYRW